MAASSSEESLASLCREAEQLKVKIDEEKQKVNDLQRKFHFTDGRAWSIFFLTKQEAISRERHILLISLCACSLEIGPGDDLVDMGIAFYSVFFF